MGPNPTTSLDEDTQTQGRRPCDDGEKIGRVWPQAKGCLEEAGRVLPRAPRGSERGPAKGSISDIWPPARERMNVACLRPPSVAPASTQKVRGTHPALACWMLPGDTCAGCPAVPLAPR